MKALIIEDETAAALNLKAILKQAAPDIRVVDTLESVEESVDWLRANPQPDLLFMDIHLADGDSFRIFDAVEVTAPVIFTTAYDRYALEAFKVNSIDYLLKPLNAADVQRALDKTLEALQAVLPEADFFRANRQFIVARRAVKEIAVWFGSRLSLSLVLETPERIVISKARVPEFKAWLTSVQPAE